MHIVKAGHPEVPGPAGGGNKKLDAIVGYLGHMPGIMAMHWNAVVEADPGKPLPLKALLAVAAVKGAAAANAMLAAGAAEYAIA